MDMPSTTKMTAELYLSQLAKRGVEVVFANAGTDFAPIIEALVDKGSFFEMGANFGRSIIAGLARAWNVPLAPHFMMELTGQVLCCLPNAHILENIDGGSLTDLRALTKPFKIVDGHFTPPDAPGHGIEFDRAYLKQHQVV